MMHAEEARLTHIFKMISHAGITCTSTLRAQPTLWKAFTLSLTSWLSRLPLRSNYCRRIITSLQMPFEDAANNILCKLLEPERRPDRNRDKPYIERLNRALHPQLDIILSINAEQNAHAALLYLVTICQTYCENLKPSPEPVGTQEELVSLLHSDDGTPEASAVRRHATASFTSEIRQKEVSYAIVRQLDGQDFLHDYAILGMRFLRLPCQTLAKFLINGKAASSAEEMVEMLSTSICIDCKNEEALCSFIEAARRYHLPARYRENPTALRSKLYRATSEKSMAKFRQRVLDALA